MTDRKKPGVAFWATVGLVVVLVGYVASFGPACRLGNRQQLSVRTIYVAYRPIIAVWFRGPKFASNAISRYVDHSCGIEPTGSLIPYVELDLLAIANE